MKNILTAIGTVLLVLTFPFWYVVISIAGIVASFFGPGKKENVGARYPYNPNFVLGDN